MTGIFLLTPLTGNTSTFSYHQRMEDSKVNIKVATSPEDQAQARTIRRQVFVDEQGIPAEVEEDGLNESAIHVLLSIEDKPVGTARICLTNNNEGEIARVAIITEFRGRGYAGLLLEELELLAARKKLNRIFLHPHHYLERFYADRGYQLVSGETTSAGGHLLITMEKRLP